MVSPNFTIYPRFFFFDGLCDSCKQPYLWSLSDIVVCKDVGIYADKSIDFGTAVDEQRLLKARHNDRPFCALVWGDLNNRLVAYEALRPHAREKGGKWELLDSGVTQLVSLIGDEDGRRELLGMDSLVYDGNDLAGRPFRSPPCNALLKELFATHVDSVKMFGLPVPLPSYKRSPLDTLVSAGLGCAICFRDVATRRAEDIWSDAHGGLGMNRLRDFRWAYFGWTGPRGESQRRLTFADEDEDANVSGVSAHGDVKGANGIAGESCANGGAEVDEKNPLLTRAATRKQIGHEANGALCLQLGWPDGVGVYRGGTAAGRLVAWETEEKVSIV